MTTLATEPVADRERLLDAVEELCYAHGVQAVGMDAIRAGSGLSLKRIYQLYPGKDQMVLAFLDRRDLRWRGSLAAQVGLTRSPEKRITAVFDWLGDWFGSPGFRGCAWINAFGELGATSPAITAAVRAHKKAFRDYLTGLVIAAGYPRSVATGIFLLAEGAMVTAAINGTPTAAQQAKVAAGILLVAHKH